MIGSFQQIFMLQTRRIAKDFDDMVGLEAARAAKNRQTDDSHANSAVSQP